MVQKNKDRVRRFKKAYPELDCVEDEHILRLIDTERHIKKMVDKDLKSRIKCLSSKGV